MSIKIDKIIRSKRKSIALTITTDARLVIRSPLNTSTECIRALVEKRSRWILDKQQTLRERSALHPKKQFVEGEGFLYSGKAYKLKIAAGIKDIALDGDYLLLPEKHGANPEQAVNRWYRREAKKVIRERVECYAVSAGFTYKSLKITAARRRWGSCGPGNTLNFTWRLLMAPVNVIDYVILHELVHTQVKNHSAVFWKRVKALMPDFESCKQWLRDHQQLLEH